MKLEINKKNWIWHIFIIVRSTSCSRYTWLLFTVSLTCVFCWFKNKNKTIYIYIYLSETTYRCHSSVSVAACRYKKEQKITRIHHQTPTHTQTHRDAHTHTPSGRPAPGSSPGRRPGLAPQRPRRPAAARRGAGGARRTDPPAPGWWAGAARRGSRLRPDRRRAPPAEQSGFSGFTWFHFIKAKNIISEDLQWRSHDDEQVGTGEVLVVLEEAAWKLLPEEHDVRLHHAVTGGARRHRPPQHVGLERRSESQDRYLKSLNILS